MCCWRFRGRLFRTKSANDCCQVDNIPVGPLSTRNRTKGTCIEGANFAAVDRATLADKPSKSLADADRRPLLYHLAATGRRLIVAGAGLGTLLGIRGANMNPQFQ